MTAAKRDRPPNTESVDEAPFDGSHPFRLEEIFEDATQVFKSNRAKEAASSDVIIAVDTNVLLLPYTIRKNGLPKLQTFYQELREENRLYLPARVAREFIVNRDRKLSDLLKTISDVRSRLNIGETKLSPILEGIAGSDAMASASKALVEAKKQYTDAIGVLEKQVRGWSGDDPITSIYNKVFDATNIVSPTQSNEEILDEWRYRLKERIPPGFKDGAKSDTGIGDFLVWKTPLALGKTHEKDLIFITGEEKADWYVRANGEGAYPRPELVAEYREHSGGKCFRLVEFHDVLREMDVAQEVVIEVEKAEVAANNIIRSTSIFEDRKNLLFYTAAKGSLGSSSIAHFRMRYGGMDVRFLANRVAFTFRLSEQFEGAIWVYQNGSDIMTSIPEVAVGSLIDSSSMSIKLETLSINIGQMIYAKNAEGYTLVARLIGVTHPDPGGAFEATFMFAIYLPGSPLIAP